MRAWAIRALILGIAQQAGGGCVRFGYRERDGGSRTDGVAARDGVKTSDRGGPDGALRDGGADGAGPTDGAGRDAAASDGRRDALPADDAVICPTAVVITQRVGPRCQAGELVLAGSVACTAGELVGSFPFDATTWSAACTSGSALVSNVLCLAGARWALSAYGLNNSAVTQACSGNGVLSAGCACPGSALRGTRLTKVQAMACECLASNTWVYAACQPPTCAVPALLDRVAGIGVAVTNVKVNCTGQGRIVAAGCAVTFSTARLVQTIVEPQSLTCVANAPASLSAEIICAR